MKIIAIPLILFLIISTLLFSGRPGVAEKFSVFSFFLILGGIIWGLVKTGRGDWGDMGDMGEMGKKKLEKLLIFLGFGIPYLLIYKAFFISGPLAWGDAPFFNPENLKELFNPPFLWNFKDNNFGSTQYHILWLYLPTYLYGLLNHFWGLGNDLLIRLVFYLPATILAILGSYKFIGKFSQNIWGKFLGSFLYGFNTYFLMLIDGGQVGVALAYGLFPLVCVSVLNYLRRFSIQNFFIAALSLFGLVSADIRIGGILVFFVGLIWGIGEFRGIREVGEGFKKNLLLGLTVLGLSSFWILPTLSDLDLGGVGSLRDGAGFISLTNTLFLFQPHFPFNEFGKIIPTPFYFVILPILFFGSLFLGKEKQFRKKLFFALLFLIFAFLAKGGSEPFGNFYSWFVSLPGGVAFRDFSKFYIPLILSGGVLLSFTVGGLERIVKKKEVWGVLAVGVYGYLLVLIHPALFGNLTGTLGEIRGIRVVGEMWGEYLSQEQGFIRSLYFEEKPATAYFNWKKPAISANNLYQERPFASMIVGKYDLNNFLHNPQLKEWLNLLGVKYVFFPGNERKKVWSMQEQKERKEFLTFTETISGLKRLDWQTNFPAYEVEGQTDPRIFGLKKAYFIVGGEDIYQSLFKSPSFSLHTSGLVFLEDGKVDLGSIQGLNPESLVMVFYGKDLIDLQMVYFIKNMVSPSQAVANQWKIYGSQDYLVWKYELLKNNIDTKEFDFGKGVTISTITGEKMKFKVQVPHPGNYFLAARFTNSLGDGLKLATLGQEFKLQNNTPENFRWEVVGPMRVDGSDVEVEITNEGNFALLNTFALIPDDQLKVAEENVQGLTTRFKTIFLRGDPSAGSTSSLQASSGQVMGDWGKMINMGEDNIVPISYKQVNPTQYQLTDLPEYPIWIVFSDHYHQGWDIEGSGTQVPFYATINGFYIENPQKENTLIFAPQKEIWKGIFLSVLSFGIIGLSLIYVLVKERKEKRKD